MLVHHTKKSPVSKGDLAKISTTRTTAFRQQDVSLFNLPDEILEPHLIKSLRLPPTASMQTVNHFDACWSHITKPLALEVQKLPFDKSISWLPPLVFSHLRFQHLHRLICIILLLHKCKGTTTVYLQSELSAHLTALQETYPAKRHYNSAVPWFYILTLTTVSLSHNTMEITINIY